MERLFLAASTLLLVGAIGFTLYAIGAGRPLPARFNLWVLSASFAFQTVFLFLRGQAIGRCPLTSVFEVLLFLSWSMVLIYLIVGPAYRLSLMGGFTAPLAFLLQLGALMVGDTGRVSELPPSSFWLELHAALSVIAYGAFALGCVAGVMYLVQQSMLKTHHIHQVFYWLPPIQALAQANVRLLVVGLALLTAGLIAGLAVGYLPDALKMSGAAAVWLMYAALLAARAFRGFSPKRLASLSVYAFGFSLAMLMGITLMAVN